MRITSAPSGTCERPRTTPAARWRCCSICRGPRSASGSSKAERRISRRALTPKDIEDLKFGLEHEVDYVALSFVRSADDLRLIKRYAPTTPIIAKLEKPQAVDRVDEIAQLAEGVMIARGDLGVEMPL